MTQFYEDFRGQAAGTVPAGFSAPWGALDLLTKTGNPVAGSDIYLEIAAAAGLNTSSYDRAALEWAAGTTSGVTSVRARMLVTLTGDSSSGTGVTQWIPGGLLSASGASSGARTGYAQWLGQTRHRIRRYDSAAGSTIADIVTADTGAGPQDLFFEVTRNGDLIESRTWPATGARPSAADASATDVSPLTVAGFFGLSLLPRDSGSPPIKLYQIAVGTDGDTVPIAPVATGGASFIEALTPSTATTSIQKLSTVYGQSDILALTSSKSAVIALDQAAGHSDPLAPVLSNAQLQLLDIITGMVDSSEALTASSAGVALVLVSGVQDQLVAVMTPTVAIASGQQLLEHIGQIQELQAESSEAVTVYLNLQAGSIVSLITALSAETASSDLIPLGVKTGYSINAAPAEAVTGTLTLTERTGQVITLEPSLATASGTNLQLLTGVIIGSFRRSSIIDMSPRYSAIDKTPRYSIEEVRYGN